MLTSALVAAAVPLPRRLKPGEGKRSLGAQTEADA